MTAVAPWWAAMLPIPAGFTLVSTDRLTELREAELRLDRIERRAGVSADVELTDTSRASQALVRAALDLGLHRVKPPRPHHICMDCGGSVAPGTYLCTACLEARR